MKVEGTREAGAEIVFFDRATESREAIGARLADEKGATLVPSFDDVDVIEGQGSVGVEIAEQLGVAPPMVIVPCGGGGLSGGIALALPGSQIDYRRAGGLGRHGAARWRAARSSRSRSPRRQSRCDALQTKLVSPLTFGALREAGARGLAVSEEEVAEAMRFAFRHLRIVAEPGGSVALAALLAGKVDVPDGAWSSSRVETWIRRFTRRLRAAR